MMVIRNLVGQATEAPWTEPRGVLQSVHHEVAPGCFLFLTLGAGGLVVSNGTESVGVPLSDLVALAQQHQPAFVPR